MSKTKRQLESQLNAKDRQIQELNQMHLNLLRMYGNTLGLHPYNQLTRTVLTEGAWMATVLSNSHGPLTVAVFPHDDTRVHPPLVVDCPYEWSGKIIKRFDDRPPRTQIDADLLRLAERVWAL